MRIVNLGLKIDLGAEPEDEEEGDKDAGDEDAGDEGSLGNGVSEIWREAGHGLGCCHFIKCPCDDG